MPSAKWFSSASVLVIAATTVALFSAGALGSSASNAANEAGPAPVSPPPVMRSVLERTQTADGELTKLGSRYDATFYRIVGAKERGDCFAVGYGEGESATIGLIACGENPDAKRPVVDSSVFETVDGVTTFDQLIGWTATNVDSLTLFDSAGVSLVSVRPEGGFYYVPRASMPKGGARLAAFDSGGEVVWSYDTRQ